MKHVHGPDCDPVECLIDVEVNYVMRSGHFYCNNCFYPANGPIVFKVCPGCFFPVSRYSLDG